MNRIKLAVGKKIPEEWFKYIERYTSNILLALALVMVFGMVSLILLEKFYRYVPDQEYTLKSFITIVFLVTVNLFFNEIAREMQVVEPSLSERIKSLTNSLRTSADALSKIEEEIKKREVIVRKLKEDEEASVELAKLTRPEVEAVVQSVDKVVKREGRVSFIKNILTAAIFFLLGWILPPP